MIGGTDDELAVVADGVRLLAERYEARDRAVPADVADVRRQLHAWRCLQMTDTPPVPDPGDGDDVMAPLLLTRAEAAGLLRLSERSVARAVADGHLQVVRCGKAVRIRPVDLESYVAALAAQTKETVAG